MDPLAVAVAVARPMGDGSIGITRCLGWGKGAWLLQAVLQVGLELIMK